MAAKTKLEINAFIKGLITEAGALTFPDNASLVNENLIINKDGSQKRRLGMDYEIGYLEYEQEDDVDGGLTPATSIHLWKNPLGSGEFDIIVVQTSNALRFFRADAVIKSDFLLNSGSPNFLPSADYPEGFIITTASLRGKFIVCFGAPYVVVYSYNNATDTVTSEYVYLKTRDVFGIDDGFANDFRPVYPSPLTPADSQYTHHEYNIRNQGWPLETRIALGPDGAAVVIGDPTDISVTTGVPNTKVSNADVFWRSRATAADIPDAIGAFSAWELMKQDYGTSPAPKGKNIIDIFERSDSRQTFLDVYTGDPTLLVREDRSVGYVANVASYMGRFFYSVVETELVGGDSNSPHLSSMVFFSKVVESSKDVGMAHSVADVTSEFQFDTVDTDGGFVSIPEAGKILKLAPLGSSLFVFAKNGVWEIHGGETSFSATNVNVTKTSNVGAISNSSVVASETVLTYWAAGGIYLISIDEASQRGMSVSITANTIKTLYDNIPYGQKVQSTGVYEPVDRKIRWLYSDSSVTWPVTYNKELVFDIDLRAFYTNKFAAVASTGPKVGGVIDIPALVYLIVRSPEPGSLFFSFGSYRNSDFNDFGLGDAKSILLTGYLTGGAASLSKQVSGIVTHFRRTETGYTLEGDSIVFRNPSGCLMTPQWEWTNSPNAGKWGETVQVYRLQRPYYPEDVNDPFDYGYTVITAKSGIRGRGRALSLKFESEPEKDMHILGWGLEIEVEQHF